MPGLIWPARRYVDQRNPQGVLAAPVGSYCVRESDGAIFRKVAGGGTPFGWYLESSPNWPARFSWLARLGSGAINVQADNGPNCTLTVGAGGGFTNTNVVGSAPGSTAAPRDRIWTGGYTSAAINTGNVVAAASAVSGLVPSLRNADYPTQGPDWDLLWEVFTSPRSSSAATSTDLANIRLWVGLLSSNNVTVTPGALANSDELLTCFATSNPLNAGHFGVMFRFSTAAADAGWVVATGNDNGVARASTITPVGAIAINTAFRLRLRMIGLTVFASIDDGVEVAITGNVGPGTVPALNSARYLAPVIACQSLAAAFKSFAFARMTMTYGAESIAA